MVVVIKVCVIINKLSSDNNLLPFWVGKNCYLAYENQKVLTKLGNFHAFFKKKKNVKY